MKQVFTNISLFLVLLFIPFLTSAQYQNVRIEKGKGDFYSPCEPVIAIDPMNPDKMVAGAMIDRVYFSKNGGQKWRSSKLKSSHGVFGDPFVLSDGEAFYYFHLSDPEKTGWSGKSVLDRIVSQKSTNGKSWNSGSYIGYANGKQHDSPAGYFDAYSGNIYLTWTQYDKYGSVNPADRTHVMFTYSDNRGRSWQPPMRISEIDGNCLGDAGTISSSMPTVGPDGTLYVSWLLNDKIFLDRSNDGGMSWLRSDRIVIDVPGGSKFEIPGFGKVSSTPIIECDRTDGIHSGNLYLCWSDQRNGDFDADVWLVRSLDGGDTWSTPTRVNNDAPGNHQFFSSMAVDQATGTIYVVFYDRRNHDDWLTDVYLAVSTDGGQTFSNEMISASPFETDPDIFFGDRIKVAAHGGKVRPVWTRVDDRILSIWTALINIK
ncbi:MAG: glycosyl hydrolase [Cyclobacteriaceae bacterium]